MKLVCFDMDGVIFRHCNFWLELHKAFGTFEEGKKLTDQYLTTDYGKLVEEVVARLWKGRKADPYYQLVKKMKYNPGVRETFVGLKKAHMKTIIISSGPYDLALRAQKELGVDDIFTNELVIRNNIITGEFDWPIGFGHKQPILVHYAHENGIMLDDIAVVGDEENDVEIAKIAGIAIAFNSTSDKLKKFCDVVINSNNLKEILRHLV